MFFSLRPYYPKYLSFREALQIIEGFLLYIQEHGDDISYVTAYTVMTRDFELIATGLIGFLG